MSNIAGNSELNITNAKLCIPIVSLSTDGNVK